MIRKRLILPIFVGLLLAASVAAAKEEVYVEAPGEDWGVAEDAAVVPEGLPSFLLAGRFDADDDVDAFTFTTTEPMRDVQTNVVVPICGEHFAAVYPSVAIIGPGLPEADLENEPFTVPKGMGVLMLADVLPEEGARSTSDWEYFNQYVYAPGIYTFDLPEAGEYSLVVWEPNGIIGAYMVDFGGGDEHAMDETRSQAERDQAFSLLTSGRFMDTNCRVPVTKSS